ncbi:MAG: hypothetical protein RLZZ64_755, partial [Bacteroidota bacterium]
MYRFFLRTKMTCLLPIFFSLLFSFMLLVNESFSQNNLGQPVH